MCYITKWPNIFVCYLCIYIIIKHWSHVWLAQCCPDLAASSRSSSSAVVTSDLQWSHHCHHHQHHDHHSVTQYTRAHHHPGVRGGHESGQWENENSLNVKFFLAITIENIAKPCPSWLQSISPIDNVIYMYMRSHFEKLHLAWRVWFSLFWWLMAHV